MRGVAQVPANKLNAAQHVNDTYNHVAGGCVADDVVCLVDVLLRACQAGGDGLE